MCILKEVTRANFEKSAVTVCAAGTNTSKCFWVAIWKTVVVEENYDGYLSLQSLCNKSNRNCDLVQR